VSSPDRFGAGRILPRFRHLPRRCYDRTLACGCGSRLQQQIELAPVADDSASGIDRHGNRGLRLRTHLPELKGDLE
jgi:hypothetical protein